MSPRRHHRKSRNGCQSCKVRHIKCDEGLPKCTFCATRQLECSYARIQKGPKDASRHKLSIKHSDPDLTLIHPEVEKPFTTTSRLLDSRLLHHYSTVTCKSLTKDGDQTSLYRWQTTLPSIAIAHTFVLDSLLALSALHLAHLQPSQRHSWGKVALRYNSTASAELRNVIIGISNSMIKPAFVCSTFILLGFLGQQKVLAKPELRDPLSEIIQVRELLRGCMLLHASAKTASALPWEDNSGTPAGEQAMPKKWQKRLSRIGSCIRDLAAVVLDQVDRLLHISPHPISQSRLDAYTQARLSLEPIISDSFPLQAGHDSMLLWPVIVPQPFIELLKQGDLIARLIFLPYAVWLHLGTGDVWIFSDLGLLLVRQLLTGKYEEAVPEGLIGVVEAALASCPATGGSACMIST
ncbi:hypothetical protein BJY04DRAFT_216716 [Aspergillus karnatakaensis]|uniref:Zn(II)2Cys6 transcription factor domain-containing protein n=1 Tax=Aspergillus karnatakaensis TaxID=1810916 RepID=UPI003CCD909B